MSCISQVLQARLIRGEDENYKLTAYVTNVTGRGAYGCLLWRGKRYPPDRQDLDRRGEHLPLHGAFARGR